MASDTTLELIRMARRLEELDRQISSMQVHLNAIRSHFERAVAEGVELAGRSSSEDTRPNEFFHRPRRGPSHVDSKVGARS
jgi:predicted ArsR family transcriptional regulator